MQRPTGPVRCVANSSLEQQSLNNGVRCETVTVHLANGEPLTLCEVKVFAESGSVFGAEGQTKCDATRHYYEFVSTEGFISWADARAAAAERGGYLATITSEAEQSCLTDLQGGCGWLGGNDVDAEGAWEWNTGEDWAFENWAPGEPNNCLLYTSPSPRDKRQSRMPSSA